MKNLYLIFLIIFFIPFSYGQDTCDELRENMDKLKLELEIKKETISSQSDSIRLLKSNIQYYRETLDLLTTEKSSEINDVNFKINHVVGDLASGRVKVEGILTNTGPIRSIQAKKAQTFDPKGNTFSTYKIDIGGEKRIEKLLTNVPIKFSVEYDQMSENVPILKALILDFYSKVGYKSDGISVTFKNLPIVWE